MVKIMMRKLDQPLRTSDMRIAVWTIRRMVLQEQWSGREDSNLRPLPPEDSALPG